MCRAFSHKPCTWSKHTAVECTKSAVNGKKSKQATGMLVALAEVRMSWGAHQGATHAPTVRVIFPHTKKAAEPRPLFAGK